MDKRYHATEYVYKSHDEWKSYDELIDECIDQMLDKLSKKYGPVRLVNVSLAFWHDPYVTIIAEGA